MFKKENQKIIIDNIMGSKARLTLYENSRIKIQTDAFIGKNGITKDKKEGDGKTPIGKYELGMFFGLHNEKEVLLENYFKINGNLYWVDDVKSKYYNQLVDITKVKKQWNSAEHLIQYPKQYEYAIEIKANPDNIPGKGSAIFLHCSVGTPTAGCIAISREEMKKIFQCIKKGTTIHIKKH